MGLSVTLTTDALAAEAGGWIAAYDAATASAVVVLAPFAPAAVAGVWAAAALAAVRDMAARAIVDGDGPTWAHAAMIDADADNMGRLRDLAASLVAGGGGVDEPTN